MLSGKLAQQRSSNLIQSSIQFYPLSIIVWYISQLNIHTVSNIKLVNLNILVFSIFKYQTLIITQLNGDTRGLLIRNI